MRVESHEWGRVADDGTVFVRTADGERAVGQYPEGTPEEALRFYTERYAALEFEVGLLDQRIRSGVLSPEEATTSVAAVRSQVVGANAVGDLDALSRRLDDLQPVIAEQREVRRAERAARIEQARTDKERIVAEAERLAQGSDWRNGVHRLRDLLEEWKALPRLDKAADEALWRRFSGARTTYTRRRKAHFAEQQQRREGSRVVKERLVARAEELSTSTEWGPTSGAYRDLMREWKAAGPAPREVEETLWRRFRGAQDAFFGARDAANAQVEQEYAANAAVKEQLLVEAEQLVPVTDLDQARRSLRDLSERWEAAGKVPRDRMKELEGRFRAVEQAVRAVEQEHWRRSDPEKSARASDMVTQLETAIAKVDDQLTAARAAGDDALAARLESDLAARQEFLETARRASADYAG